MRQVGATIGVAILGTVLSSAYRSQADVSGLPPAAAAAVRNGIAVARQAAPTALPDTVRTAFAHALDVMLGVCGGITLASALLALAFLPRPTPTPAPAGDDTRVPAQITQQTGEPEHPGKLSVVPVNATNVIENADPGISNQARLSRGGRKCCPAGCAPVRGARQRRTTLEGLEVTISTLEAVTDGHNL